MDAFSIMRAIDNTQRAVFVCVRVPFQAVSTWQKPIRGSGKRHKQSNRSRMQWPKACNETLSDQFKTEIGRRRKDVVWTVVQCVHTLMWNKSTKRHFVFVHIIHKSNDEKEIVRCYCNALYVFFLFIGTVYWNYQDRLKRKANDGTNMNVREKSVLAKAAHLHTIVNKQDKTVVHIYCTYIHIIPIYQQRVRDPHTNNNKIGTHVLGMYAHRDRYARAKWHAKTFFLSFSTVFAFAIYAKKAI